MRGWGRCMDLPRRLGRRFQWRMERSVRRLLAPVMAANIAAAGANDPAHPVLARYARIGSVLAEAQIDNERAAMEMGVVFVRDLCKRLAIPSLARFGVTDQVVPEIVAAAQKSSSMRYNPAVLSAEVLARVLREAL